MDQEKRRILETQYKQDLGGVIVKFDSPLSPPVTISGENLDVGTTVEDLWGQGGTETVETTNSIDSYSSSSGSDTGDITVEGYTVSSGVFTYVSQTVTLAGQTETLLTTALARVTRVFNAGSAALVGDVYIYEDDTVTAGVPQTAGNIHAKLNIGDEETSKALLTVRDGLYFFVTSIFGSTFSATNLAKFTLQVKESGGVFRDKVNLAVAAGNHAQLDLKCAPIVVPANADVKLVGVASGASTHLVGGFTGFYAKVETEI